MLDLFNIIWVVPGLFFLWMLNSVFKKTAVRSLSGWPYVFTLVFIACITWLPSKHLLFGNYKNGLLSFYDFLSVFILSITLSLVFALVFAILVIYNFFIKGVDDVFFNNCVNWEDELVFLTLNTGKLMWVFCGNIQKTHL